MLITGVSGLLGSNVAYCLRDKYEILGVYHAHTIEMEGIRTICTDLTSSDEVASLLKDFKPDVIVHCAAQADVDKCEEYPEAAERINVLGTQNIVKNLNGSAAKLLHISTDLVYSGQKDRCSEDDPVGPLNHYGRTKCRAEQVALERKGVIVLRTNFFGWNIQNKYSLGEWVIHELTHKKEVQGFTDCHFSSIYTFELAGLLDLAIQKNLTGVYNFASSTSMSKYDFVSTVASRLSLDHHMIKPVSIDQFGFKAQRSKSLSLDTQKLSRDLAVDIPTISYSIGRFVEDFQNDLPAKIRSEIKQKNIYPALLDKIPYGRQSIDEDDIAAVVDVLKSESITQGPKIREFEDALLRVTGASHCVAVNSGTSALHIACLAAGVTAGDEVITSPNTFVASANCAVYCGGRPIFADIDPRTYNVSPMEIEKKINARTKAIIPVHFAGQSCDMEAIQEIVRAKEKEYGHKIYVIEDACHAIGSEYKGDKVGACRHSDMAAMSFHPVKHITTGEGGCVFTGDKALERKLRYFRSHGISSDLAEFKNQSNAFDASGPVGLEPIQNPWYYEQHFLGYNYRITEIQCALGISQLRKLDIFCRRRREIVDRYNQAFQSVAWLTTPYEEPFCRTNFHLYVLQFDFNRIGKNRAQAMLELRQKKIQTQVHYIPVHTHPFYRETFGTKAGDCPVAERYYQQCMSIPLYPVMDDTDVERVIDGVLALAG